MFCAIQHNTYGELVLVAKRAFHILRKAMDVYPYMQFSQKEMVLLWDDRRVIPDANGDGGARPSYPNSARVSHFFRNSYLDMANLMKAVHANDTSLIEIGRFR